MPFSPASFLTDRKKNDVGVLKLQFGMPNQLSHNYVVISWLYLLYLVRTKTQDLKKRKVSPKQFKSFAVCLAHHMCVLSQ